LGYGIKEKHMKKLLFVALIILLIVPLFSQEKKEPVQIEEKVKAWQMPNHMIENLMLLINQRVEEYKTWLKANVKGFEDMPDNVVFDINSGLFLLPEDLAKLQEKTKPKKKENEK